MKQFTVAFIVIIALFSGQATGQSHSLVKLWQTDTLLKTPESVLFDEKAGLLYVSNIATEGNGSIGKVGLDGKIIEVDWVKGLKGPKGMGIYRGKMYVADVTDVVVIDIAKARVEKRIPIENAVFLNDVSIDKKGVVYVSDTRTMKVHAIKNDNVILLLQNLQAPNGLLAVGSELLVLDKGTLLKMTPSRNLDKIADGMDPSTDGIEMVKPNEYIVSCWNGVIYYIEANGNKTTLLDNRSLKINTADIGYDARKRIVYVPTFYKNHIAAYELK